MLDVSSVIENMKLLHGKPRVLSVQEQRCQTISAPGHVLLLCAEKPHRLQSFQLGTPGIGVGQDSFLGTSCLLLQKTKYEYSA